MNRRFRAGEMSLGEVAANLAPFRPHVETSPEVAVPPRAQGNEPAGVTPQHRAPVGSPSSDYYRRRAFDALHTYIWNACGNDFRIAQPIFNRVVSALEMNLDRKVQAEQGNR